MIPLVYFLHAIQSLTVLHAPSGTLLPVRMLTPIASYSSAAGAPLSAVLIAPVRMDGNRILPAGAMLSGTIKSVTRVGLGIQHECAALVLDFNRLTLPDGAAIPIAARVFQVDNARERVTRSGVIQGVRATGSISYRVSGYIQAAILWPVHADVAEWAVKSLLLQLPEPEIYYPAGTEFTVKLTKPLTSLVRFDPTPHTAPLPEDEAGNLQRIVAGMPFRTSDPESRRPSDLVNILLIGTRSQIVAAFHAAGWTETAPDSMRARIGCIRAAAEIHGFAAPMTSLLLNGAEADISLQKGLNDVAKRHHIRIWKRPGDWHGQELWMAAATRDVDLAYLRPGRAFTHRIDANIDEERDKVAHDLEFTSCASPIAWSPRPDVPHTTRNGTGDSILTDARLVVMRFSPCMPAEETASALLVTRGGKWQRFARREILVTRSDLMRDNIYWRSFEAARWSLDYARARFRKSSPPTQ